MHTVLQDIRAVFFDAVGTLLHPAQPVTTTYRTIALEQGLDLAEMTLRQRLISAFTKQERIDHTNAWRTSETREVERWRNIVAETFIELKDPTTCFTTLWEWYSQPQAWQAHPETAEVLSALDQAGLLLGMASNFDARLNSIIGSMPVFAPLRERCVISSLVTWRKPAALFFQEVVKVAGCRPEEILFIGDDRRNDYDGARQAGLRALLLVEKGLEVAEGQIRTLKELLLD